MFDFKRIKSGLYSIPSGTEVRRGFLEKLCARESLKPRDFPKANPKANPKAKPEGLPSENPEAFRLSRGRSFSDNSKAFQQFVGLWFPRDAGTDLP